MGLSKRYIDTNEQPVTFESDSLGSELLQSVPTAVFMYLLGSAADGAVPPHSDLDLAVYLEADGQAPAPPGEPVSVELYSIVAEVCERIVGPVRCDLGILNGAELVYRFEALKGRLLFCRDREQWLRFYSVTCREYEHQLFHYEKQRRYRVSAAS